MVTEAEALDKSHADLARRLADAGRKIESDAKVIAALREALKKCATKLERCAIAGGTTPEYAALVVEEFRAFEQTAGEKS